MRAGAAGSATSITANLFYGEPQALVERMVCALDGARRLVLHGYFQASL